MLWIDLSRELSQFKIIDQTFNSQRSLFLPQIYFLKRRGGSGSINWFLTSGSSTKVIVSPKLRCCRPAILGATGSLWKLDLFWPKAFPKHSNATEMLIVTCWKFLYGDLSRCCWGPDFKWSSLLFFMQWPQPH